MTADRNRPDPDKVGAVWARTTPSTGRAFVPILEIDDNTSVRISPERAAAHATAVSAAIARAEHDAFVVRQLRFLVKGAPGLTADEADGYVGQVVLKLRSDRRPIVWPTPLRLEPGVSAFTGEPFLTVFVDVRAVGQWEMDDARRHVAHVFEVLEGARLDGAYLQMLIRRFDLDEMAARRLVACLADPPPQRGNEGRSAGARCPDPAAETHRSPDCKAGKHAACTGDGWCGEDDLMVPCPCGCHR